MEWRKSDVFIGNNLSRLRKSRNMTQTELAKLLFVSSKTVSKWERGRGYPELPQLLRISDFFGVSVDALIRGEKHGIAIAGNLLCDNVKMIDMYPKKEMLANICDMSRAVGGCVPNTLINLAKIDPSMSLFAIGRCGKDEAGGYILGEMSKCGIVTRGVVESEEAPTAFSDVMTVRETGERTFFYNKGANAEFSPADVDMDLLHCRMLHIGYIHLLEKFDAPDDEYGTVMARFLHEVKKRGIATSIDMVSRQDENFTEIVVPALRYTDNVIINEVEASGVSGLEPRDEDGQLILDNIRRTMEIIMDCGVGERVIVHCPEAGFALNSGGEFTVVPSLKLPKGYIRGTVGAGDAFCAGCLYGIYNGYSDRDILTFAAGAAACNLSAEDSVSGMKNAAYIRELIEQYRGN